MMCGGGGGGVRVATSISFSVVCSSFVVTIWAKGAMGANGAIGAMGTMGAICMGAIGAALYI